MNRPVTNKILVIRRHPFFGLKSMLRVFDIILSSIGLIAASPIYCILTFGSIFDSGSPFFRQTRIGRGKKPFDLVKFRTMRPDTVQVATHLVNASAVTTLGKILRKTKVDELPQLWNVLKGEMSLVGPRPCLKNQAKLIRVRQRLGVFSVRPGITGLAQIHGIDMSEPGLLAQVDEEMIKNMSIKKYFKYIILTIIGWGRGDRIIVRNKRLKLKKLKIIKIKK